MTDHADEIASNLERAKTNLQAARDLSEKGLDSGKHSGVIALIHQHFVKTG